MLIVDILAAHEVLSLHLDLFDDELIGNLALLDIEVSLCFAQEVVLNVLLVLVLHFHLRVVFARPHVGWRLDRVLQRDLLLSVLRPTSPLLCI